MKFNCFRKNKLNFDVIITYHKIFAFEYKCLCKEYKYASMTILSGILSSSGNIPYLGAK